MTAHFIIPPYLLKHLEQTVDDPGLRAVFGQSLQQDRAFRARLAVPSPALRAEAQAAAGLNRVVHDAERERTLPGRKVRAEGDPPSEDAAVNEAYDGTGATWKMFSECFGRDSIDGAGMPLHSTVHYDRDYANAFWDGAQMVFGDGDGVIFQGFTRSIDVTGHELAHGVTQHTADLVYEGQSGALNESMSDVFGSLAKQHHLGQSAAEADWIIGADLFAPGVNGVGLRSMKEPGSAYDDPRLGKDPQPGHMDDYVETEDDNGGVHINSGIPNRAFYLAATELGGNAYGDAGKIWYHALTSGKVSSTATFAEFAQVTIDSATELHGAESTQNKAVRAAWQQVGVTPKAAGSDTDLVQTARLGLDPDRPLNASPQQAGEKAHRPAAPTTGPELSR
ncbi:M4 family metallopeptidase [Kribbella sp. NBC_01245]|uniref:M4 family metallopeptidase n=1 Tax=Kribbella sp. NBC_01245 TaxID=2903578 RepID=UPI002E28DD61|nr:M4 family metallopeptidase [Kribbella sp. NBC_01245]